MPKLTIGRMAKLYGLHRSTLYEAITKGRISTDVDGRGQRVIDLSEMIRRYGEAPGKTRQQPDIQTDTLQTHPTPTAEGFSALLEELRLLREEVAGLRAELRLLEHKPTEVSQPIDTVKVKVKSGSVSSFADLLKDLD
jgi:hypothetical protein